MRWFITLMAISASAFAADPAPLPTGFEAEAASTVPGVFAHGISYENGFDFERSLSAATDACESRRRKLEYVGNWKEGVNTSWWLYRSGNETAVFRRDIKATVDTEQCRVTFDEKREVRRSTEKAGAWPSLFSGGRLKCSGLVPKCYPATMFGIKARCRAEGNGFEVTRDCVSIERGPSRGMLLESVYESDDMQGYGFAVRDLKTNVPIDVSLFDKSRSW
jgi:hypothetical protein